MSDVKNTLAERKASYGPYDVGVKIKVDLLKVVKQAFLEHHGYDLPDQEEGYFWDVLNKLSRLAVNPWHKDSWHDLAGYALRIEEFTKDGEEEICKKTSGT